MFNRIIVPLLIIIFIVRKLVELSQRMQKNRKPPERYREETYHAARKEIEKYLESEKEETGEETTAAEEIPIRIRAEEYPRTIQILPELTPLIEQIPERETPLPTEPMAMEVPPQISAAEEAQPEISIPEALSKEEEEIPYSGSPLLTEILFPLSTDKLKQGILLSAILGPPRAAKLLR